MVQSSRESNGDGFGSGAAGICRLILFCTVCCWEITAATQIGGADTGFGQFEAYLVGSNWVAGQSGDDGADLFVAGSEQERWCPSLGFHSGNVEVLIGVG